ncbi:MAG: IMPACT family member YigZ [Tenericutes bacterium ADurb.Bin239]|jgi:uncharacterized YigZ family protein|nr:MAG: IMPACT family member YigZ [Tenericutes bacterium ADurb.Bin239]
MGYVINKSYVNEIVVEKSRFIALLHPLSSDEDFDDHFEKSKKTYRDARHYTFAFRYGNLEKCSDDGEPQNTAGLPLLNLLKNHNLVNTAIIVVRYFGGKKLGAGRLLRTYVDAGNKVILLADKYLELPAFQYEISVPISDYERTRHYLEKDGYVIDESDFSEIDVRVLVRVSKDNEESFESLYNVISKKETVMHRKYRDEQE